MTGRQFKAIRDHLGLTQVEMGFKIGVTPNTIARWERDEVPISPTAKKLAITFLDSDGIEKVLALKS